MSAEKEPNDTEEAADTSEQDNMNQEDDDLFRSVYTLEEQLLSKGLKEGHEAGRQLGWLEGRDLGIEKGSQTGQELGYYAGIAELVLRSGETEEQEFSVLHPSTKCCKTAEKILDTISTAKLYDPQSEQMMDDLQVVRARFKVLINLLKLTNEELAYDPDSIKEKQEMSF
eukprot:gb/GECG01007469.1/.p1 GENE.gb/GECG01007469.1/~~gb/GECG01007469.1/.p1  ORF type:complete len:170 (+),score=41.93 gb/GECG01007469.1/:1-510(+)